MSTVILTHTGLEVPADHLVVVSCQELALARGVAFKAPVRLGGQIVGTIENHGTGADSHFVPFDFDTVGEQWFRAFVAACRMDGAPVDAAHVLDWLMDEYDTARAVAAADLTRQRTVARKLAGRFTLDLAQIRVPRDQADRARVAAELDSAPGDAVWQLWNGEHWEPLATAAEQ